MRVCKQHPKKCRPARWSKLLRKSTDRRDGALKKWQLSERRAQCQLGGSRIAHGGNLLEGGRRIVWVRAAPECAVQGHAVHVIEKVEGFGQGFQPEALRDAERAAQPGVDVEKVKAASGVAVDEGAVDGGPGGGALNGDAAGGDIEWERRVVLQQQAELETVTELLPRGLRLVHGGMDGTVEDQAVALV